MKKNTCLFYQEMWYSYHQGKYIYVTFEKSSLLQAFQICNFNVNPLSTTPKPATKLRQKTCIQRFISKSMKIKNKWIFKKIQFFKGDLLCFFLPFQFSSNFETYRCYVTPLSIKTNQTQKQVD